MKLLLDTLILLWAPKGADTMPTEAADLIDDPDNELLFSVASIWEVTIKFALGRPDFKADPRLLRRGLIDNGYIETPITGEPATAVAALPNIPKDPFDRLLVAQAMVEGVLLLTTDNRLAACGPPVRKV